MKHLQVITSKPDDTDSIKILSFFHRLSKERGIKSALFFEPQRQKIFFILQGERIFNFRLNYETVQARKERR